MRKNKIRLTESQLHRVIKESVKRVLNELSNDTKMSYIIGRLKQKDDAYDKSEEYEGGERIGDIDLSGCDQLINALINTGYYNEDEAKEALVNAVEMINHDSKNTSLFNAVLDSLRELYLDCEYIEPLYRLYLKNNDKFTPHDEEKIEYYDKIAAKADEKSEKAALDLFKTMGADNGLYLYRKHLLGTRTYDKNTHQWKDVNNSF